MTDEFPTVADLFYEPIRNKRYAIYGTKILRVKPTSEGALICLYNTCLTNGTGKARFTGTTVTSRKVGTSRCILTRSFQAFIDI